MNKFLALIFILISINLFGYELPSQKALKNNDNKNLIVVLFDTNDSIYADLDSVFADEVKRSQELYNEKVQELFPSFWEATKGKVEFLTNSQASKLDYSVAKKSLFLLSGFKNYTDAIGGKTLNYYNWKILSIEDKNRKNSTYFDINYQVYQFVDESDILFYILQANSLVEQARNGVKSLKESFDFDETLSILNKKTIHVDPEMTKLSFKELTENYTGDVKISTREVINEAILTADEKVLFVKLLFATKGNHIYGVFDAENGNLVAVSAVGGVTIKIGAATKERKIYQSFNGGYYRYNYYFHMAGKMKRKKTIFSSSVELKPIHFKVFQKKAQKMNFNSF